MTLLIVGKRGLLFFSPDCAYARTKECKRSQGFEVTNTITKKWSIGLPIDWLFVLANQSLWRQSHI